MVAPTGQVDQVHLNTTHPIKRIHSWYVHKPEVFPNRTHAEHNMHVGAHTVDEEVEDSLSVVLHPLFTANVRQRGLDLPKVQTHSMHSWEGQWTGFRSSQIHMPEPHHI